MNPNLTIRDVESFYKEADTIYPIDKNNLEEPLGIAIGCRQFLMREMHVAVRSAIRVFGGKMQMIQNIEKNRQNYPIYVFTFYKHPYCLKAGEMADKMLNEIVQNILNKINKTVVKTDEKEKIAEMFRGEIRDRILEIIYPLIQQLSETAEKEKGPEPSLN